MACCIKKRKQLFLALFDYYLPLVFLIDNIYFSVKNKNLCIKALQIKCRNKNEILENTREKKGPFEGD